MPHTPIPPPLPPPLRYRLSGQQSRKGQWQIQGEGLCTPFSGFFLQKWSLLAKISIKRVRNLSQNAENGHFRDSNFQNFWGGHPIRPPLESLRLRCLLVAPPPSFWKSWIHPWGGWELLTCWCTCTVSSNCNNQFQTKCQYLYPIHIYHQLIPLDTTWIYLIYSSYNGVLLPVRRARAAKAFSLTFRLIFIYRKFRCISREFHPKFWFSNLGVGSYNEYQLLKMETRKTNCSYTLCINGGNSNILLSTFKLALLASFWVTYSFESLTQERG